MGSKITKLNRLKNPESYIQINTVKGYRYVDRAGELVNHYHVDNKPPQFQMTLESLIFYQPKDRIDELKISSNDIWAKFLKPDSLDQISTLFGKESHAVSEILGINQVSRIGWRNYFVYEFQNMEARKSYFDKLSKSNIGSIANVRFNIDIDQELKASLAISPVQKHDEQQTQGALFDLDVYSVKECDILEVAQVLRKIRQYLQSQDGFLKLINVTLE